MENLSYDCHTHTNLSDGRNTPDENVRAAEACGLRCVAITDHLFPEDSHDELLARAELTRQLDDRSPITVLPGVEGVILDIEGTLSVSSEDARAVKLVLVDFGGRTRGIAVDPPAHPRRYADNVLAAMENAACNPVVDVIAHPFNLGRFEAVLTPGQFSDASLKRVARAMYDNNVAFEIMNQAYWWYPQMPVAEFTAEFARLLTVFSAEGVKFVVGSDAHSVGAVGNLRYCRHLMREAGIEMSQLVDLERMAAMRDAGA